MRNRKSRVFVVVCIILLVASVAEVSILTISSYHRLAEEYANDFKAMLEIRYGATVTFLIMIIPMVLPEFSFIRSGYQLFKHQPRGAVKICLILSAILAFLMALMVLLWFHGIVSSDWDDGMFLSEFSVLLASLVLGSIRKNKMGAMSFKVQCRESARKLQLRYHMFLI